MKNIYKKKEKKEIADTTCKAIQQLYPKSTGKEKLKKATERLEAIFKEKELQVSKLELRVLIESSVHNIKQPSLKLSKERKSL